MLPYDDENRKSFIEKFKVNPYEKGVLSGLSFGVKDIIDIKGLKTGCGNPSWRNRQKKAVSNAVCVDQLLANGALCKGKTHTDEFAFSLLGENQFYGTPLNPAAPNRVPGGSSSGSASAVACGIVDFALGTDTGGSIRVPASNCGIWGFRPSHGRVSVAGVHPFAPTFDTVGVLSSTYKIMVKTMEILLGEQMRENKNPFPFVLLKDAFNLCDEVVQKSLLHDINKRCQYDIISFSDIFGEDMSMNFDMIFQNYCKIQWAEIWNTHGPIITYDKPELGQHVQKNFDITSNVNRSTIQEAIVMRELFAKTMNRFLNNKLLLLPTSPTIAPLKMSIGKDRRKGRYYPRTLGLTAISGLARLPQISIPLSKKDDVPLGLSILSKSFQDADCLEAAKIFN